MYSDNTGLRVHKSCVTTSRFRDREDPSFMEVSTHLDLVLVKETDLRWSCYTYKFFLFHCRNLLYTTLDGISFMKILFTSQKKKKIWSFFWEHFLIKDSKTKDSSKIQKKHKITRVYNNPKYVVHWKLQWMSYEIKIVIYTNKDFSLTNNLS